MPEKSPPRSTVKRTLFSDSETQVTTAKLKRVISKQKLLLKQKNKLISRLKQRVKSFKVDNKAKTCIEDVTFTSKYSEALANMQVRHKSGQVWTKIERDFSLLSFYKSPGAYKYWRNTLKIVMPGLTTIHKWIGDIECLPGFNQTILNEIKRKVNAMGESERYCTLIFDEITIKQFLEYSRKHDRIEGFYDHGERKNQFGRQVMLFLIRGIYANWKLPFAYFVSDTTMKNIDLYRALGEALKLLLDAGLKIVSTVCDQGKNNQSALSMFGVSKHVPYFQINNNRIYHIYDVLHLVKNLRNNILKNRFLYKNEFVDFKDIIDAYNIDQTSTTSRSMPKLSDSHMQPDSFEKMNCRLATQIFSNSVAAGIRTVVSTGELTSSTALHTADFVTFINNLFDCLNSKQLYSVNPYACALSPERPVVQETLEEAITIFETIQKEMAPGRYTRPDCFDGMVHTLRSVLGIYHYQKELGFKFLLTNRLNQDPIENKFASIRQRGGFNMNPTVRSFRTTFRLSLKVNLLKPSKFSNCEEDEDSTVILQPPRVSSMEQLPSTSSTFETTAASESSSSKTTDSRSEPKRRKYVTLQECSDTYFTGYLVKKTIEKYKCDTCKKHLIREGLADGSQLLIMNRTYKNISLGLRKPDPRLTNFVRQSLLIINRVLNKCPQKVSIGRYLEEKIQKLKTKMQVFAADSFKIHYDFLINLMIRCKINKECKWRTLSCRKICKKKRKLDIVQNL